MLNSIGTVQVETLQDLTSDIVSSRYKYAARFTHPDMPGGSVETFARVDWAKQVLLAWLSRDTVPVKLFDSGCANCYGSGRVKMVHGFKTYTVVCGVCRGAGTMDVDNDKEECDD